MTFFRYIQPFVLQKLEVVITYIRNGKYGNGGQKI